MGQLDISKSTVEDGLKQDLSNELLNELKSTIQKEIDADNILPPEHPEVQKFNRFFKWLKERGVNI